MGPDTPHMLFSVTKSFTGLLAEILIAEGTLDPEKKIEEYVPELKGSVWAGSSLRSLLDMTDGVDFDENYSDPEAEVYKYSRAYWGPAPGQKFDDCGVYSLLPSFKNRTSPAEGKIFKYRTPAGDVVGWALQKATGESLKDLFFTRVWAPSGASDEAYLIVDTAGQEIAATG
jgi:CubicO group peptidase (beta-lactamase class C family)